MMSNEERVLQALVRLGGAAKGSDVCKLLGWESQGGSRRVGQLMGRLIQRGRVRRLETGRPVYAIVKDMRQRSVRSLK